MNRAYAIVIVGGGMIGLTLAALLAMQPRRQRLLVTVVDAAPPPAFSAGNDVGLRVSAISAGSMRLFDRVDIGREVRAIRASPYRDMRVWDAAQAPDGPGILIFSAAEFALPELGCIVENSLLCDRLRAHLGTQPVMLRFDSAIRAIERTGDDRNGRYRVCLAAGDELQADLLIGADGAQSAVRESAAIAVDGWPYSQAALVTHASPEKPHCDTAWQRFLADGPIALLPLHDGRVSIVWSTGGQHAEALLAASDSTISEALSVASDHALGRLTVAGGRASFPLSAQHARHYVRPGLALVGDAAHTVHPLAGQGANLGLADVAALSSVIHDALAQNEHPGDLPVLRRYERGRRGANATMLHFVDGLSRLFAVEDSWLVGLRGSGMRLFNRSGPLKRRVMRVALGL